VFIGGRIDPDDKAGRVYYMGSCCVAQ